VRMESAGGEPEPHLEPTAAARMFERDPWQFSFFQAVRLLQRMSSGAKPVGYFNDPRSEAVRFGSHASLSFPASEIQSLENDAAGRLMRTNFFGLIGALGVLPTQYTSLLIERLLAHDATMRDFLDIFHHRLVSLFYRSWEKYHYTVAYERSGEDSLTPHLLDLLGLGTAGLQRRQALSDESFIAYAGLLCQFPRSESAFRQVLSDYFQVPATIETFAGTWRKITPSAFTRLGEGRTAQLGAGAVLGDEVWDQQSAIRVRLGPLTLEQYKQFLPDGSAFQPLKALKRFFCGEEIDVELQLVLDRNQTPRMPLGVAGQPPARLGWISWMFSQPLDRDPDETIIRLWET
jgi:type VI secretion system protein ImpH